MFGHQDRWLIMRDCADEDCLEALFHLYNAFSWEAPEDCRQPEPVVSAADHYPARCIMGYYND